MKKRRFLTAIGITVSVSFLLALGHYLFGIQLMHNISEEMFMVLDSYVFFLSMAFLLAFVISYQYKYNDLSETFALITSGFWALFMGLEDFFVFVLNGFPETMPWLNDKLPGLTAGLLGMKVTPFTLALNIIVTGVIIGSVIYVLYSYENNSLKINI